MDLAGLFLLVRLLEDERLRTKDQVVPLDPVLAESIRSRKPKPIKVDDTQVRPRGRFGL